jgi:hypothetical protein
MKRREAQTPCYPRLTVDVPRPQQPDRELSSWKEIAAYLGVGVRTAQIWEHDRGLPVRRLPGGRGRVLATTRELEEWKRSAEPAAPTVNKTIETQLSWLVEHLRSLFLLAGLSVVLVAAVVVTLRPAERPVSFRLERNVLVVLDDHGRELWRKIFPYALVEAVHPDLASRYTWIGDLDGDGRQEVLFAPHGLERSSESTPLICYSNRGRERWRFVNRRTIRTATEQFSPVYGVSRFLVTSTGKGKPDAVLVSTTHALYYPCEVALLSAEGKEMREYWHSGHLNQLSSADLNGDGENEFYLAGIDNGRHAATLVVLDTEHFSGASSEPTPAYQFQDFAPGSERARLVLPRSCLNTATEPYNTTVTLEAANGSIDVQTNELLGGPGAGIIHHFTPDLRQHRFDLADSYRHEFRRSLLAGEIHGCAEDDPQLSGVQTLVP